MLNRAKYFQQLAGSIDSTFTQISHTMGELDAKEAMAQENLAKTKLEPEIARRYTELINNPEITPDQMKEAWEAQYPELKTFALEGVTNKNAQGAMAQNLDTAFANYTTHVITTSIQRKADNVVKDTSLAIENLFNTYGPKDTPEDLIEKVKEHLGYVDGKLVNPVFSVSETKRLLSAYEREALVIDADMDIETLLTNDMTKDGITGYMAANEIIDKGDFTKPEADALKTELDRKYHEIQTTRTNNANAFNQAASDTFSPMILGGNDPTTTEINDYYDQYPNPVDVQDARVGWLNLVIANEAEAEAATLLKAYNDGEEIPIENISPGARSIIGEENLAIMGAQKDTSGEIPEKTTSGGTPLKVTSGVPLKTASGGFGGGSGGTITLYGLTESNPTTLVDIKTMYNDPSISSEGLNRYVLENNNLLTQSDINKFGNVSTRDSFIQTQEYKDFSKYIDNKVNDYYKDDPSFSKMSVASYLRDAAWKAYTQNPDMNLNEYSAQIDVLFNELIAKKLVKDIGKMEDLRNGGKGFEKDLKNEDSYETFMGHLQEGKYEGLIDMDMIEKYVQGGLDVKGLGFDGVMDYFSTELWGEPYDDVKDKARKNITALNATIALSYPLTSDLFAEEVAPEIGDYISVTTDKGLIFIDKKGIAYRSRLQGGKGGKGEIWETADIGEEYYKTDLDGQYLAENFPENTIWARSNYSTQYVLRKKLAEAKKNQEKAVSRESAKEENKKEETKSKTTGDLYEGIMSEDHSNDIALIDVMRGFAVNTKAHAKEFWNNNIIGGVVKLYNLVTRPASERYGAKVKSLNTQLENLEKGQKLLDFENLSTKDMEVLLEFTKEYQVGQMREQKGGQYEPAR